MESRAEAPAAPSSTRAQRALCGDAFLAPPDLEWVAPRCRVLPLPIVRGTHRYYPWTSGLGSRRHLDSCDCRTFLHARLPRVKCGEHGIRQVRASWASPGSQFSLRMESRLIDTLKGM